MCGGVSSSGVCRKDDLQAAAGKTAHVGWAEEVELQEVPHAQSATNSKVHCV